MYERFAGVYDAFMENIPYSDWAELIRTKLFSHGIEHGILLDLGCGTGVLTRLLSKSFDMIGIDSSFDMLSVAKEYPADSILYLCQDMRELDLYGSIISAYSMCDSMNYILNPDELKTVFSRVSLFMEEGGLFIFDMRTGHLYRDIMDGNVYYERREDCDIVWENTYDEETKLHEYFVTMYSRKAGSCLYERFEERHLQRAYDMREIEEILQESGFTLVEASDEETGGNVEDDTKRMLFVSRLTKLRQKV